MAQINAKSSFSGRTFEGERTFEGGKASNVDDVEKLKRSVMATMLWEDGFYEDGEEIAERIIRLTKAVDPVIASSIMIEAKEKQKIRHAPLLMAVALAENGELRKEQLTQILTRADDITELLAIYWKNGKRPIDHQIKKGIAIALKKFDEYQLAKYNRDKSVRLKDVLRLVHPKPDNIEQSDLWKRLLRDEIKTPDTWEVALSAGADKKETFTRLIKEKNLGDLAFLRNLRNMLEAGVDVELIRKSFSEREWKKILPFQFITAARHAPALEPEIEQAMLSALKDHKKLYGRVTLLVDGSGSMSDPLSKNSELQRFDVACGLAILIREICSDIWLYRFNTKPQLVPSRHGFALRDALGSPDGGTEMWKAINEVSVNHSNLIVVITDEQTRDDQTKYFNSDLLAIINVGDYDKGVGYGKNVVHINGWSENVVDYLLEYTKGK